MRVVIFGASGGIGKWAVKHAKLKGYEVTAFVRNANKIKDEEITVIQGSISNYQEVKAAVSGKDAVIWTVGIPMENYEKKESLEGHQNLIKAMKEAGVRRLIDWGTPSIQFEKDRLSFVTLVPKFLAGILYPKGKEELIEVAELIKQSDLDWTIVRFLRPLDAPYTGKVTVGFGDIWFMGFSISREDIGAFMVEQVEGREYVRSMPIICGQ